MTTGFTHDGADLFAASADNAFISMVRQSEAEDPDNWPGDGPQTAPTNTDGVATVNGEPALLAMQSTVDGEWFVWQQPGYFEFGGC